MPAHCDALGVSFGILYGLSYPSINAIIKKSLLYAMHRAIVQKEVNAVRDYEVLYIIDSTLEEEAIKAAVEKFSGLVTANGGAVESVDEWGRRRLAYPIDYKTEGYYVLMNFNSDPEFPKELERNFKIDDTILRYMVTVREATKKAGESA